MWRPCADHGQKHETGERMHSELDDKGPITEATERKTYVRDDMAGITDNACVPGK